MYSGKTPKRIPYPGRGGPGWPWDAPPEDFDPIIHRKLHPSDFRTTLAYLAWRVACEREELERLEHCVAQATLHGRPKIQGKTVAKWCRVIEMRQREARAARAAAVIIPPDPPEPDEP
jgi:hypothetical protein